MLITMFFIAIKKIIILNLKIVESNNIILLNYTIKLNLSNHNTIYLKVYSSIFHAYYFFYSFLTFLQIYFQYFGNSYLFLIFPNLPLFH